MFELFTIITLIKQFNLKTNILFSTDLTKEEKLVVNDQSNVIISGKQDLININLNEIASIDVGSKINHINSNVGIKNDNDCELLENKSCSSSTTSNNASSSSSHDNHNKFVCFQIFFCIFIIY